MYRKLTDVQAKSKPGISSVHENVGTRKKPENVVESQRPQSLISVTGRLRFVSAELA